MAGAHPSVPTRLPSAGRAAAPVSSALGQFPLTVPLLPSFASQIGPPPKTKGFQTSPAAHLRPLPEDEPIDLTAEVDGRPLEVYPIQHPYVSFVSHLSSASSDPMAELTGSSSGLGVKGGAGRERLQRELAQQNGQFFLKVCQAIHRRQRPTTALPDSLQGMWATQAL